MSLHLAANQSINENEDGNLLTATESPSAATSREWMWTTTSGSGYQSFSPTETTTTYTPNFATTGTYYVICESDFAGDIQQSNEVTIIVAPEGTGIDEENIKFSIFNNGNAVQVEYDNAQEGTLIEMYTLEGKQIYRSNLPKGVSQHNVDASPGVYIYRVIDGDLIITGKVNL